MHKVFAAVRIWQLMRVQDSINHGYASGVRIFGADAFDKIIEKSKGYSGRDELLALCFAVLHNANWTDDTKDIVRSMSNMETAAITYADERMAVMEQFPIWVADYADPDCQVGIEQVFDVVLLYEDGYRIRYIGTVDGLVMDTLRDHRHTLEDNKTAARLDTAFKDAIHMKYQFTGYMACSTAVFGIQVFDGRVIGTTIRPSGSSENYVSLPITRDYDAIVKWGDDVRWFESNLYKPFGDDGYEHAPRFTHSCNRYFRPCALIPFCADSPEGRKTAFEQEMVPIEPSPSERAVLGE